MNSQPTFPLLLCTRQWGLGQVAGCKLTKKNTQRRSSAAAWKAAYLTHVARIKGALAVGWNHTVFSSKSSSGGASRWLACHNLIPHSRIWHSFHTVSGNLVLCVSLIFILYNNSKSPELVVEVRWQTLHILCHVFYQSVCWIFQMQPVFVLARIRAVPEEVF